MCTDEDVDILTGYADISFTDYIRIEHILQSLGFYNFATSFFFKYHKRFADEIKQFVKSKEHAGSYKDWRMEFYNQIDIKSLKEYCGKKFGFLK